MENIDWVKIKNIINNFECETTWWTIEDNAYRTALKLSDCLKDYLPIKNKLFEIIKPIITYIPLMPVFSWIKAIS